MDYELIEMWRKQMEDALALARYYERVPEDQQKAAGAREARRQAEWLQRRIEEEMASSNDNN